MFVGHAHGEHDAWTLLGQTSCVSNLDRFFVRVTWTLHGQVSCASNRFLVRVTWTLLGQVSCASNLDTAWAGFLCE